jgi:glycolate oxidase FAD binding subunit
MASADTVRIVRDVLGDGAVAAGDALGAFAVDGQIPRCVAYPETSDALSRCAAALHEAGLAVIPAGNGTHLSVGRPPRAYDVALSTRRMRRVVAHEAADLTVTVEAGCTLAELNDVLASAGQLLPLDPPHPEQRTVGSIIATDAWGPWRLAHGKVRDLLIGVTLVLASGTVVRGGGRVVKNVAGYDLMKLFTGSFGTLGIVVEATFKVRPRPEHTAVLVVPVGGVAAAAALGGAVVDGPLAPHFVEVVNAAAGARRGLHGAAVVVGCAGVLAEVEVQHERMRTLPGVGGVRRLDATAGQQLYTALRDLPDDAGDGAGGGDGGAAVLGCALSVVPSRLGDLLQDAEAAALRQGAELLVRAEVGVGTASVRCLGVTEDRAVVLAEWLREATRAAGGWIRFDVLPTVWKTRIDPWGGEPPGVALMRGVKHTLDPKTRLSPGRFVGGI